MQRILSFLPVRFSRVHLSDRSHPFQPFQQRTLPEVKFRASHNRSASFSQLPQDYDRQSIYRPNVVFWRGKHDATVLDNGRAGTDDDRPLPGKAAIDPWLQGKIAFLRADNGVGNSGVPASTVPENIVFPADAGIVNVKAYGAVGDGVTDDTKAIQAALNAYPAGNRIIYLPRGTYLVSDTLKWPAGYSSGSQYKYTILQGQNQAESVIKLKDNAPGFTDADSPKTVIYTGPKPAQRFRNAIRNLTVDTGTGNAGAIGVQFNASNQGAMRQVTIQSGDGQGVRGLDMLFTDEVGPLLVSGITVKGFRYGIYTGRAVNSQTFEHITLMDQTRCGFYNTGQVINIRKLTSYNRVTALQNHSGHLTLIDATLMGTDSASDKAAIVSDSAETLLVRNVSTSGYKLAIQGRRKIWIDPQVTEYVSGEVSSLFSTAGRSLNLPIKETPDVPWDDPNTGWANVVSYGAIPNDDRDDTAAIQAAIDSGKPTVYLPVGTYHIERTVLIRNNVRRIIGTEARVYAPKKDASQPTFKLVEGNSSTVVLERIQGGYRELSPTIENASARTLAIRSTSGISGKMTGSGDVFLEDVVGGNWRFGRQNVWARQFNVENRGTHITNDGGNLWILGLKTEQGGTIIETKGGGKTELLGALIYTTAPGPDNTQNYPMFINTDSNVSLSAAEVNFGGGPEYRVYVRDTRNGETRDLLKDNLPKYQGTGRDIPLYVSGSN